MYETIPISKLYIVPNNKIHCIFQPKNFSKKKLTKKIKNTNKNNYRSFEITIKDPRFKFPASETIAFMTLSKDNFLTKEIQRISRRKVTKGSENRIKIIDYFDLSRSEIQISRQSNYFYLLLENNIF